VIQGEPILKQLLGEHHMKLRYLRHPYLDTGKDLQTRREAEAFLTARGYSVAPVTLDAWNWMYAPVYGDAKKRGDAALEQKLVSSYLSYSDAVFAYCEQLSTKTAGYDVRHSAAAWESTGGRPHRRASRRATQARVPVYQAGGGSQRPGVWAARHVRWGRRNRVAGPLGDYAGQAAAGRAGVSAVGDRPGAATAVTFAVSRMTSSQHSALSIQLTKVLSAALSSEDFNQYFCCRLSTAGSAPPSRSAGALTHG
jgi:hypothetical protein